MSDHSVTERLVAFMHEQRARGVPDSVLHEANRLLINQLKASVGATDSKVVQILHDWALAHGEGQSTVLWYGTRAPQEYAAIVNGALFEVLDFNDTYIPCFMHAVSGVLPAALATAEAEGSSGRDLLTALALGIEVELACATMLMPTAYYRGFIPGGMTGAIGGAAACALLTGLDDVATCNALGLAMNTGMGTYQAAGFMSLSYVMGLVGKNGLTAAHLAARGLDSPRLAFEGDKGMLLSYSDEPAEKIDSVLSTLGSSWRLFGQSYKTVPTETITHGPIECVFQIHKRANGRTVRRMRFGVEAIVVKIADERMQRFGIPDSDLTAKFDLRYCAAAAWHTGRFTLAEMREAAYKNPQILELRSKIDVIADPSFKTFDGAALEVEFTDGSTERARVSDFRGTPGNPLTDDELSAVFRTASSEVLSPERANAILATAWTLRDAPDIRALMALLTLAKIGTQD